MTLHGYPPLLTNKEVQSIMRLSRTSLWRKRPKLMRCGVKWIKILPGSPEERVDRDSLESYLQSREIATGKEKGVR